MKRQLQRTMEAGGPRSKLTRTAAGIALFGLAVSGCGPVGKGANNTANTANIGNVDVTLDCTSGGNSNSQQWTGVLNVGQEVFVNSPAVDGHVNIILESVTKDGKMSFNVDDGGVVKNNVSDGTLIDESAFLKEWAGQDVNHKLTSVGLTVQCAQFPQTF